MMRETTNAGKLGDLQRLVAKLSANSEDLPHLEASRVTLEGILAQAQDALGRQAAFTAGKQEATKQLQTLLVEGMRLANVLRLAVKQHFGIRSEKLAEFGLQPFRGRPRVVKPDPEEPEEPSKPADRKRTASSSDSRP
jgi:hypothetical protein